MEPVFGSPKLLTEWLQNLHEAVLLAKNLHVLLTV